jgi:hypothetical protein
VYINLRKNNVKLYESVMDERQELLFPAREVSDPILGSEAAYPE